MEALSSKTADSSTCAEESKLILVEIKIPDLNIQKCFQFHADDLLREVKFQCLCALPKELNESFNYGLYYPPCNGKAGKFLDEERPLSDYPFHEPVGYLELKYKRRVYKLLNLDAKQIKFIHSRANIKRFMDFVHSGQSEKITKMCNKGLDPNFHWGDTGETPLSTAASLQKCSPTIVSLVNGGALLDYRNKDGSTALHRAVERNNFDAVKTLLDLGASPNYRDCRGLTPLYYSVMCTTSSVIPETLLHDHAFIGCQDLQGWQEVHQACRNSLVHHLEHLLYYGADMNARNASGNTPLHVCAVNNQEPCARVLLFRGADKEALNYANQTPYQVAVIAQNFDLAERIKSHKEEDIVLRTSVEDKPPVISLARKFSTLPRKLTGRSPAPVPPKRDPKTTLSLGKVRAKSLIAQIGCLENEASNGKTATIRPRPNLPSPKVYASVAEMKRWKATRRVAQNGSRLMRNMSSSVPELTKEQEELAARRKSHSQESLPSDLRSGTELEIKRSNSAMQRSGVSNRTVDTGFFLARPAAQFIKIKSNNSCPNSLHDQNSSLTSFASNSHVSNHVSHVRNGIVRNEGQKCHSASRSQGSSEAVNSISLQRSKQKEAYKSQHDEITRFGVEQRRADSSVAQGDKFFLKNSSSCPQELMSLEDGDNSSSGVSSDQDNQTDNWRRGPRTSASEDSGDFQRSENYDRKEKLVPLSPLAYDTDPDENKEQDTISSVSTLSSSSDTVREVIRPSSITLKQSDPKATPRQGKKSNSPPPVPWSHRDPSQHELNKSIEKSLQMIRRHADAAGDICFLPKVVPPPFSLDSSVAENVATISPPPEFCDSDDESRRPSFNFNHPCYKTTIRLSGGRTKVIQQGSVRTKNRPFCLPAEARNHFSSPSARSGEAAVLARRVPADFRIQSPTYASVPSKYSPTPFVRDVPYRDAQLHCQVHPGSREVHPWHQAARRDVSIHSRGWFDGLHASEYRAYEQHRSCPQAGISSPYEISSNSRKVYQKSANGYPHKRYVSRGGT